MPIRPIADAQSVFKPHADSLIECVNAGYDEVYERCGGALSMFETRTKRAMFRDAIVRSLRAWADITPGVQFFESGQLKWIGFANQWIVRVKAIDDKSAVAVSPTGASEAYDRNELPESIANTLHTDEPATMLYIGHKANENAPTAPEISLICNNANAKPEWIWSLTGSAPHPTLELPTPTTTPPEAKPSVRVRLKGKSKKKAAD